MTQNVSILAVYEISITVKSGVDCYLFAGNIRLRWCSGIKIVEISKFEIFSYVTDSDAKFIVDSEYVLIFTLSLLVFEMSI